MENKLKVVNKGYTITVTSWENDGDNYNTKEIVVDSLEEAKRIHFICTTLFESEGDNDYAIGNSTEFDDPDECIQNFIKEFPELNLTEDEVHKLSGNLLGYSDYYTFRVCESVVVTYSPEDIYVEQIKF